MKAIVLLLVLIVTSIVGYSQTADTIPIYDQNVPRNFDYQMRPEMKMRRDVVLPQLQNLKSYLEPSITITRRQTTNDSTMQEWAPLRNGLPKGAVLVIINNKIYTTEDKEFRELDPTKILDIQIVNDESSRTNVKGLILIRTK